MKAVWVVEFSPSRRLILISLISVKTWKMNVVGTIVTKVKF